MGDQTEPTGKPFPGYDFDTFDGCVRAFSDEDGIDDPEAFCAWLDEHGREALSDPNAEEVLTGLEVEFVSAVDEPAQDSEWVIAKDATDADGDTHRWQSEVTLYVRKDHDDPTGDGDVKQVAFAPVLIPKEADKQGDVIPQPAIEDAAHKYLAEYRKVDSDHDLRDGKGTPVESWTLKQNTTFELPDGSESREYPEGTWVMGIKFDDDTWARVVNGELSGLSIYGGAKPVDVDALLGKGTETMNKDTDDSRESSKANGRIGEFIMDNAPEDADEADVAGEIASIAGRDTETIEAIINANIECPDIEVLEAIGQWSSTDTEDVVDLTPDSCDYEQVEMSDETDPGDTGTDDSTEPTNKQDLNADQVSAMLAEFRSMVEDGGLSRDATVEDFVRGLIDDGNVDESAITGLSVFLNGGGSGGGTEPEADGSDEEMADAGTDDDGVDLDAGDAGKAEDAATDGGDVDKTDDSDGGDVTKSVDVDDVDGLEDVVKAVDDLRQEVDDLRAEVKDHPDADKMEPAASDRIAKDLTGIDDPDVARKAIREQVAKSDDDSDVDVDYSGITEGEDADASATGREHSAAANSRMVGGDN